MSRILSLPSIDGCLLWQLHLDASVSAGDKAVLSDDERARAGRFVFARDRRRFVAARSAMRQLIGMALGRAPDALPLAAGPHGKPHLADVPGLRFNLSHSHDVGILAIDPLSLSQARAPIGVDVEVLRPVGDALALAEGLFEPDECAELARLEEPARSRAFLMGWTRKEACLKALSSGFSGPSHVATGLAPTTQEVRWREQSGDGAAAPACAQLHSFELPGVDALAAFARLQAMGPRVTAKSGTQLECA